MGRKPPPLSIWLATLSAAFTVVFAGASATSVLDRVQHAAQLAHEHGIHLAFSADDHHPHDHAGDQGDAADHQPGAGHHHADAPAGLLGGTPTSARLVLVAHVQPPPFEAAAAKGVRPGGLERPPRRNGLRI